MYTCSLPLVMAGEHLCLSLTTVFASRSVVGETALYWELCSGGATREGEVGGEGQLPLRLRPSVGPTLSIIAIASPCGEMGT